MDFQKTFNKYIHKNAINVGIPHKNPDKLHYRNFVIIPCYNEFDYIFDTLESINVQNQQLLDQSLVIIIINNSNKDSRAVVMNNQSTYELLLKKKYNFEFIAIDCFSKKNSIDSSNAGVGYARKIGHDFSLKYIQNEFSLLCSLDADTLISKNYLNIVNNIVSDKTSACVLNFKHQKSNDTIIEKAIRKYENQIKYIARKIHEAGSPYGYVSMGSTIICNVSSYIACRGMSIKKATEDFYFLQSLAKYTKIKQVEECLVFPSSRAEERVYLGTGYRINEFRKLGKFENLVFSDSTFQLLKQLISIFEKSYNKPLDVVMNKLDEKSCNFINSKKLSKIWSQINLNAKNEVQFKLFFHQWFDALMIMQFLKKLN